MSSDKMTSKRHRAVSVPDSGAHYRAVADAAADAIITINAASTILLANPAAETIFGYSVKELVGRQLTMLMPKHLRMNHRAGVARYLETRKRHLEWNAVALSGLHKDGHEIPLEISFLEFVKDGQRFFTGIIRQSGDRAQLSRDLHEHPELVTALINQSTVGVSILDLKGFFTFTNDRLCQIVGRTREELLKTNVADITHADDLPASTVLFQRARDFGESFQIEMRYLRPDGSFVWVHNSENILNDSSGKKSGLMGVTLEITKPRTDDLGS